MGQLISFFLIILLAGTASASDLGTTPQDAKTNTHIGINPGTPDGREGGEDMSTAVIINTLPFDDTGQSPGSCEEGITIVQKMVAGPCLPATMTIQENQGTLKRTS